MKNFYFLILAILLIPQLSFARGDSGHMGDFAIGGFYGLASVSPTDLNGLATAMGSSPPVGGINSDLYYGGLIEFMMSQHFNIKFEYDMQDAKDLTSTNLNSSTGFEVQQNDVWGILDFYLVRNSNVYAYVGGGVGYPTYCHLTRTNTTTTQFDAAKNLGYIGNAGIGVMLGNHISLFFEGGYQSLISGNVTSSSGAVLTNTSGQNAVINLSGLRAEAGLKFHF